MDQQEEEKPQIEITHQEEFEKIKKEREEYLAGWQRARADYMNFQKDEQIRFEQFRKSNLEDIIRDLLVVMDSFDAARRSLKDEGLIKELLRIEDQLKSTLKRYGVEEVAVSIGDMPNPLYHEAIEVIEGDVLSGTILEVLQKGYTLHGKVMRSTKIKVAK